MNTDALRDYLDARLGDSVDLTVEPMAGGGSCDVYALTRGDDRWVLRQAPPHRSSATAHDVLREFRFLDAIKDQPVRIARPVLACDDPDVFGLTRRLAPGTRWSFPGTFDCLCHSRAGNSPSSLDVAVGAQETAGSGGE